MDRPNEDDVRGPSEDVEHTGTLPVAGTTAVPVTASEGASPEGRPDWIDQRRAELTGPGRYLAYEDSGRPVVLALTSATTRIGRSLSAEVRFDDATVSRRHALVVIDDDGIRVLDDRSLNGVQVNGQRVDSAPLSDGDQITVGRHRLHYLDNATVGGPVTAGSPAQHPAAD